MSPRPTADAVRDLVRPLRSLNILAWTGLSLGLAGLILGTLAWIARFGWFTAPYWVLLAWVLVLIAALSLFIAARQWGQAPRNAGLTAFGCQAHLRPDIVRGELARLHQRRNQCRASLTIFLG